MNTDKIQRMEDGKAVCPEHGLSQSAPQRVGTTHAPFAAYALAIFYLLSPVLHLNAAATLRLAWVEPTNDVSTAIVSIGTNDWAFFPDESATGSNWTAEIPDAISSKTVVSVTAINTQNVESAPAQITVADLAVLSTSNLLSGWMETNEVAVEASMPVDFIKCKLQ